MTNPIFWQKYENESKCRLLPFFPNMLSVNPCIVFDARNINLSKVISVVYKLYLW